MASHAKTIPDRFTNRLIHESSPYLLQHAHNPVDWHSWGEEAIERARREDKLIFLSIGYSTCYWCHVMERESFEDEATARVLNEKFICIKVDREERPDVDDIYMTAVQVITGRGGWPMSMWLAPKSLEPVYGGTYFPPEAQHGLPSFTQVLEAIDRAWREDREGLLQHGGRIADIVRQHAGEGTDVVLVGMNDAARAINRLIEMFDPDHGGFGDAPKFPQPTYLELLLQARDSLDASSLTKVNTTLRTTLDRMAMGGMYDQVGGGFHRYSTDAKWLVPHFEKMLYDNAQLASIYARASEVYGDAYYARIARETLEYVLREMRDEKGGFFSAQDAEVNAREGLNYLWTVEGIRAALAGECDEESVRFAIEIWGLDRGANFRDPHHPEEPARNVLRLVEHPLALAKRYNLSIEDFWERVGRIRTSLLRVRMQREQPATDDKVLCSWNGLMIAACACVGRILGETRFIDAARDAAQFILASMLGADGRLQRTYRNGESKIGAFLEDYSHVTMGLLGLHRATKEVRWLDEARLLTGIALDTFGVRHGKSLVFYDTRADQADLFVRNRSTHDGAVPCGTSVMLHNLLDLHDVTRDTTFLDGAAAVVSGIGPHLHENPLGPSLATAALIRIATDHPSILAAMEGAERSPRVVNGPVHVRADRDVVRLSSSGSDLLRVSIELDPGHHINAHEPGDPALVGLLIHIVDGEGLIATAAYPEGELYRDEIRVHRGHIEVAVTFERIEPVTGEPRVAVRWQACTETECLPPREVVLDVRLVVEGD